MKKSIYQIQYDRLAALYHKLNERLQKHFALGRFSHFTKRQQHKLLHRITRLKEQLAQLEYRAKIAGATLLLSSVMYSISSQAQTPVGTEFRVNTYTTDSQSSPDIASDNNGNFVIVWQSDVQDGSGDGVYAQRYNSSGVAQGIEFRVNTTTTNDQRNPHVAIDSDGDFVVSWTSYQDGSGDGIYAQRFNALGVAQGVEFKVNTYTTNSQRNSDVAMDNNGNFVVVWSSAGQDGSATGIYAQRYDATGAAQGGEFRVNTVTAMEQEEPKIAMDSDGDFVVTWQCYGQDGDVYGVYAQRFNASAAAQGSEFKVNTHTTSEQSNPAVAMDDNGNFVIAWDSDGQDEIGTEEGIYAQRYNATGVAQGTEFKVNTYITDAQDIPSVAMDSDGDFVIAWRSEEQGVTNGYNSFAQRYNASGVAQGSEFQANTFETSGYSHMPVVSMDSDGDFVMTWWVYDQDGDDIGVYAQRFSSTATGVVESTFSKSVQLYPNPAQETVYINASSTELSEIRISDSKGLEVYQRKVSAQDATQKLDVSFLSPGLYYMNLKNESGETVTKKLVIQKK